MITGKYSELKMYENVHQRFKKAFDFLDALIAKDPADGHYTMPDCDIPEEVYINVMTYSTKPKEDALTEYHKKYIDIHVVLEGEEAMLLPASDMGECVSPYSEENDCGFTKLSLDFDSSRVVVKPGHFVICFPNEGHAPGLSNSDMCFVHKMIIKVLM